MKKSYSSKELQEFKEIIETKLISAEEDYKLIEETMSRKGNGTDDTGWTFNVVDDGQVTLSREENNILAQKLMKFINALKNALNRIENKTYGICASTGNVIPKERLMAVPHATTIINVKNQQ